MKFKSREEIAAFMFLQHDMEVQQQKNGRGNAVLLRFFSNQPPEVQAPWLLVADAILRTIKESVDDAVADATKTISTKEAAEHGFLTGWHVRDMYDGEDGMCMDGRDRSQKDWLRSSTFDKYARNVK